MANIYLKDCKWHEAKKGQAQSWNSMHNDPVEQQTTKFCTNEDPKPIKI